MKTQTDPAHPQIPDEQGLVALARRRKIDPGGEEALRLLIEQYRLPLTSIARRCAWDFAYRDDMLQEAVAALIRAVDSWDEAKGPFAPWVRMWARGRCQRGGKSAGALRAIARFDSTGGVVPEGIADRDEPVEDTVVEAVARRQAAKLLGDALSYLPDELQAAALSSEGSDRPTRRTAEAMLRHPSLRSILVWGSRDDVSGPSPSAASSQPEHAWLLSRGEGIADLLAATPVPDPRGAWLRRAACRGTKVQMFFPSGSVRADAVSTCRGCPVRHECLRDAIALPDRVGIRAGTTERERRALKLRVAQLQ
jgi:WhiB family redox-sensing transcriptional regulator